MQQATREELWVSWLCYRNTRISKARFFFFLRETHLHSPQSVEVVRGDGKSCDILSFLLISYCKLRDWEQVYATLPAQEGAAKTTGCRSALLTNCSVLEADDVAVAGWNRIAVNWHHISWTAVWQSSMASNIFLTLAVNEPQQWNLLNMCALPHSSVAGGISYGRLNSESDICWTCLHFLIPADGISCGRLNCCSEICWTCVHFLIPAEGISYGQFNCDSEIC